MLQAYHTSPAVSETSWRSLNLGNAIFEPGNERTLHENDCVHIPSVLPEVDKRQRCESWWATRDECTTCLRAVQEPGLQNVSMMSPLSHMEMTHCHYAMF